MIEDWATDTTDGSLATLPTGPGPHEAAVSQDGRLAVAANYERLQHSIAMSPLVEQDYVFGYFAGLAWQF